MAAAVCESCVRRFPRLTRVQCTAPRRIGGPYPGAPCAHMWVIEHEGPKCPVCHSYQHTPVPPSLGDLPALYADVSRLLADIVRLDDSPEASALVSAFAEAHAAHVRTLPVPDLPVNLWS